MTRSCALAVVLVTLGVAGSSVRAQPDAGYFDPAKAYRVSVAGANSRGPAAAPVTIVEFSDFGCRYCVKAQHTLAQLVRLYPGTLRLVFRHNPLDPEDGTLAAEASLAAAEQGQFWEMHHRLFANPVALDRTAVELYAREIGLDMAAFRDALDNHTFVRAVRRDAAAATDLGVRSTPTFFINGRPVKGAQPLGVFVQLIDEELAHAEALRRQGVAAHDVYQRIMSTAERAAASPESAQTWPRIRVDTDKRYRVRAPLPGHTIGRDDALVTIVQFTDFQCGFCARAIPALEAVKEKFGDDVRIVYRHLPLPAHGYAQLMAEAAVEAGAQGKLHEFYARAFSRTFRMSRAGLEQIAEAAGLDMARLRAALDDRRHRAVVVERKSTANAIGILATPTLVINGRIFEGAPAAPILLTIVEEEIARAKKVLASGVARKDLYRALVKDAEVVERGALPPPP